MPLPACSADRGRDRKLTNYDFGIKMAFVFAGVWVLYTMRKRVFDNPELDKGPIPSSAKRFGLGLA